MVAALEEVDSLSPDEVDDPMLLGQTPRPEIRPKMLERPGLPDADERIAHDRLDQFKDAQSDSPVGLHPMAQILAKLGLEDRLTRSWARA